MEDGKPASQRLADGLRDDIRHGRLKPGGRLPSVRQLAQEQRVAPMTVQNALRILHTEGLIFTLPGRGTFVHSTLPPERESSEKTVVELVRRVEKLEREVSELKRQGGPQ
jgi:DNA-binding GntR family transcriptional regulator